MYKNCYYSSFSSQFIIKDKTLKTSISLPSWEFPGETTIYRSLEGTGKFSQNEELSILSNKDIVTDTLIIEIRSVSEKKKSNSERWSYYFENTDNFWINELKNRDREMLERYLKVGKPDAFLSWSYSDDENRQKSNLPHLIVELIENDFLEVSSKIKDSDQSELKITVHWIYAKSTTSDFGYSFEPGDRITWIYDDLAIPRRPKIPFFGNVSNIEIIQKMIN